jgi:predicted enzyme related to lactoylglutathione lyase
MAAIREIVVDCAEPDALAEFWAGALRYELVGKADSYRALVDPSSTSPVLILQGVDEPKAGKNRVHFDLEADDIRAEARRIESLGATIGNDRRPIQEHETQWMVLRDPEGNEFCICQVGPVPEGDDGREPA